MAARFERNSRANCLHLIVPWNRLYLPCSRCWMWRLKIHSGCDLDPPQRRQRTLDAVKRLLLRESQAQPLLLVFEDLHWIDSETQALLDSLLESVPTARLLLLVNYRPEYQHGWGNKTYYTQLRIDPLPLRVRRNSFVTCWEMILLFSRLNDDWLSERKAILFS